MTYTVGGLIEASDYNNFSTGAANNVNAIWSTGSTDKGYGESAIANVSAAGTVTATQWATLINNTNAIGDHQGTTITARTAPVTGNIIAIFNNLASDLDTLTGARGNAAASGTEVGTFSGTTSKTTSTGSGASAWTITFTHVITFDSANAARYFWNAGGIVKIQYGKSSTGTDADPDWNTFSGKTGNIFLTGRVNSASQTIAGQAYTGTTRLGGTGGTQTTLATTTGWYTLTGSPTTIFKLNDDVSPYSGEYIETTAAANATALTLTTVWNSDGATSPNPNATISGGTATSSPSTTITGTAPTTLVTYLPPSSTYLTTAAWGTPTIAASVV